MTKVDWNSYAEVYDLMALNNPAYQDLVNSFVEYISGLDLSSNDFIADLGAGTGNFSIEIACKFPDCQVLHLDFDSRMNQVAKTKSMSKCLNNLNIIDIDIDYEYFSEESISLFVCNHFLYTYPDPVQLISKMYDWLKPSGYLYACDIGRVLNILDWRKYFIKNLYHKYGLIYMFQMLYKGREVVSQNKCISTLQKAGKYWTHSHDEYKKVFEDVGFTILSSSVTYRGYSDIVFCQK